MFDFAKLEHLNSSLKSCLENDFNLVYLSIRVIDKEIGDKEEEENIYLSLFDITQGRESIFKRISSIDTLEEVKKILKHSYEDFILDFMLFDLIK